MVFTLKVDKIIDSIFATDTSFFTLKIENLIFTLKIFALKKSKISFFTLKISFFTLKISFFTLKISFFTQKNLIFYSKNRLIID